MLRSVGFSDTVDNLLDEGLTLVDSADIHGCRSLVLASEALTLIRWGLLRNIAGNIDTLRYADSWIV